ncbi:LytTr DNA-binding domain-containing protein [Paenibacillus algorifonticola]|uniref:LytTr DNA-binding domain-containing protein n=1 Tax=Paenibacillus algorifonticola TaxID=684063 RepID=A0A1I2AGD7_9BACL|nr:LytTR family transcriptional regulator DNA-binding domain-containing protein [Paenibacillus algorifonticola]SFE42976.1 LytTr DNA-binding domain-containing protein [Paenibacillus algorifonticola]
MQKIEFLTLTKDVLGTSGLFLIPIKDIVYFKGISEKRYVEFHTVTEVYYMMGTQVYWEAAIMNSNCNFLDLGRGVLINKDSIQVINRRTGDAYFEKEIDKKSKKSGPVFHRIKDFVEYMSNYNPNIQLI